MKKVVCLVMFFVLMFSVNVVADSKEKFSDHKTKTESEVIIVDFDVLPWDEVYEYNNTIAQAWYINPFNNEEYVSFIYKPTDVDFYKFNISEVSEIIVSLSHLPANYDIQLLNSSGEIVSSSTNDSTYEEYILYNATSPGTYYLKVYGYNGAYNFDYAYVLNFYITAFSTVDTYEANNEIYQAYDIGFNNQYQASIESFISSETDVDYYQVNVSMEGWIFVNLQNYSTNYSFQVLNYYGNIIATGGGNLYSNEVVVFGANDNSTYYIKVFDSNGEYSIRKPYYLIVSY